MGEDNRKYDLILKGGHVIDPSQGVNQVMDLGIRAGRISNLGVGLDSTESGEVRDVSGKFVCPGLIDLHGHWYEGSIYGIDPHISLNHGVTTVADAGTTGYVNFPEFRRHTIDRARIRILAFLHISCLGLHTPFAEELRDIRYARPKETAVVIEKNSDVAVGVKIRLGSMTGEYGLEALEKALEAAEEVSLPLMVHISKGVDLLQTLKRLRPGDIITHCFQGRGDGIVHPSTGLVIPQVIEARNAGIIFDVGHGCGSFSWETARKAFEVSFYPDTISTDLHRYCVENPFHVNLLDTMSKFLLLGMTLGEVILKTTFIPAKVLRKDNEIGSLRKGAIADVLVFDIQAGEFNFTDTHFRVLRGERRLRPVEVIRNGVALGPSSEHIQLRELFESDHEVFRSLLPTEPDL
jgi:dihydroorotase